MKHIVSRMSSYFPNRWPLSYLNLTKIMKTYIRRQQHKKKLNTKTLNKKNHHRSIDLERSVTQSSLLLQLNLQSQTRHHKTLQETPTTRLKSTMTRLSLFRKTLPANIIMNPGQGWRIQLGGRQNTLTP